MPWTRVAKVALIAVLMVYPGLELSRCAVLSTGGVTFITAGPVVAIELGCLWLAFLAGVYLTYRWLKD